MGDYRRRQLPHRYQAHYVRFTMSAFGYKRTFTHTLNYVRLYEAFAVKVDLICVA